MSTFPVQCFTCGKIIGNRIEAYLDRIDTEEASVILDDLRILKECCRSRFIGHVNIDRINSLYHVPKGRIRILN